MTEPEFTITVYDGSVGQEALAGAVALYREVYAEPPYLEGEDDFASFADEVPRRTKQENFRLVLARVGSEVLGFALGHQLPRNTRWWHQTLSPLPDEVTREHAGRTFAVIELAVLYPHRRKGLGGQLHTHLLAGLQEERVTLLVRPEAISARLAYAKWDYEKIGQVRPASDGPVYDLMILTQDYLWSGSP